jgi:hypothetical protein
MDINRKSLILISVNLTHVLRLNYSLFLERTNLTLAEIKSIDAARSPSWGWWAGITRKFAYKSMSKPLKNTFTDRTVVASLCIET